MKHVIGVSIGSSRRDHRVELDLLGEQVVIERRGTDGDMEAAEQLLRKYDGAVDAFGLGGIDLTLRAADREYTFRDGRRFSDAVARTPLLDGTGLKGAVEADVVRFMAEELGLDLGGKRVLVTSAVDRWGMAIAFYDAGCKMTCADLLYALGIPIMLHDRATLVRTVRAVAPIAVMLPFSWLYPSEADDTTTVKLKHGGMYRDADVIAGDFKYVRKWMPEDMRGKWVVTNTTTPEDVEFLKARGVELLVTSTPRLEGRSFGTNVMEAALVALSDASDRLPDSEYVKLLRDVGFRPDARWLQAGV